MMQNANGIGEYYDLHWSEHRRWDMSNLRSYQQEALSYSFKILKQHFGSLKNKKILEIGPGKGENALQFARMGAEVMAIDVSKNSLELSKRLLDRYRILGRAKFMQMDAHKLKFKKNTFDIVFLQTTLMHLDALKVAKQCRKVLKENGVFLFIEPSDDNALVKLYRALFSEYKETNPKYLSYNQAVSISKYFSNSKIRVFYLFSFLSLIFKNKFLFRACSSAMKSVENFLLATFPILEKKAWLMVSFNVK